MNINTDLAILGRDQNDEEDLRLTRSMSGAP